MLHSGSLGGFRARVSTPKLQSGVVCWHVMPAQPAVHPAVLHQLDTTPPNHQETTKRRHTSGMCSTLYMHMKMREILSHALQHVVLVHIAAGFFCNSWPLKRKQTHLQHVHICRSFRMQALVDAFGIKWNCEVDQRNRLFPPVVLHR